MRVNIAVCGRFQFHNYVRYLEQKGVLNRFFYSHRLSTNSSVLGVRPGKLVNIWIKEYLVGLHGRLFNQRGSDYLFPLYHDLWQTLTLRRWSKCDIFHLMLHGTGRKIIRRAREDGCMIIGQPVNSHPEFLNALLNEEHERLETRKQRSLSTTHRRLIQEVEMCDHLLVASHFMKDSFVWKAYPAHRIHVLPYGIDLAKFSPLSREEKANEESMFRVICVAQISARKGHIYLLEAWKKLNLPDSELLLIGAVSHEMKPILAKYAGWFKHIPRVPNAELRHYYGHSSVFVLPSLEDGFAYVVAEAMACGLPVITTTNTGASELIEHGKEGFIVPIRSSEALAGYLELLYQDRQQRLQMSQAASKKVRTDLSWEQYAAKLCDLYRSLREDSPVLT